MMLKTGMLWFDNAPNRSLEAKLRRAMAYYERKYGAKPTVCYLHPTSLTQPLASLDDIKLVKAADVLPNHFWLGIA